MSDDGFMAAAEEWLSLSAIHEKEDAAFLRCSTRRRKSLDNLDEAKKRLVALVPPDVTRKLRGAKISGQIVVVDTHGYVLPCGLDSPL